MSNQEGSVANKPFVPTKPADKYSDEEIRELEGYKLTKQFYSHLREEQRISLTRDALRMQWNEVRASALNDEGLSIFNVARERGLIKDDAVSLVLTLVKGDDDTLRCIYEVPSKKAGRRKRFLPEDYAGLIGREFRKEVKNSRKKHSERNGVYRVRIEAPYESDDASAWWSEKFKDVPFSATLIQEPVNGDKLPSIVFPPDPSRKSEDAIANDDDLIEVLNMTAMMGASRLKHPQSPAVYFKLDEVSVEESDDDNVAEAKTESRVHEALDDDDD
jgi:hypothetical protein